MYATEPGAKSGAARAVVILVLIFVATLLVTNPLGNFPLNDDWSYGQAVRNFVDGGGYRLLNWTSMPLLTQVLWGSLFCMPGGFSFTALRFSTLSLSLVALLLLMLLARAAGERRFSLLLLLPLALFANPVWLNLSNTFMTDVPFIAFTLGSLLLLFLGTERRNGLLLGLGVALAVLAALLRQTGLLLPIAFGIGYLSSRRTTPGRVLFPVGFFALTAVAFVVYTHWLAVTGGLPSAYNTQASQTLAVIEAGLPVVARHMGGSLLVTFTYLGIFILPFGLLFLSPVAWKRLLLFALIAAGLLALGRVLHVGFAGNILSDRGTGPFTLPHSDRFAAFSGSRMSVAAFGCLALAGGALLLELLYRTIRNAFLYFMSTSLVQQLDRYVLFYLPLLTVPAIIELRRLPPARAAVTASFVAVALYAVFSLSAVHDYLGWSRVRWQAVHHLMTDEGMPPSRIDAGFEFNGMYNYAENYVRTPGRSHWWTEDPEYLVAFDTMDGYRVLNDYPVSAWLPLGITHVYTLERARPELRMEQR
jgi:hypothetical protein